MELYWFSDQDCKLNYGDSRIAKVGEVHTVDGEIKVGMNGLHGHPNVLDALKYATGFMLWKVKLTDKIKKYNNIYAANKREYISCIDAHEILFAFAKYKAATVIDLWPATQEVKDFLSGDNSKMYKAQETVRQLFWTYIRTKYYASWATGWAATHGGYWNAIYAATKAITSKEAEIGADYNTSFNYHWKESIKILNDFVEGEFK